MKRYIIYTDGCCDPNPGPGAWAFFNNNTGELSGGFNEQTTNQRMELMAIIQAIKHVRKTDPHVHLLLLSDSKYCVKGFNIWIKNWINKGWVNYHGEPVKNQDLWRELDIMRKNVTLRWVKGHDGIAGNEIADHFAHDIYFEKTSRQITDFKNVK